MSRAAARFREADGRKQSYIEPPYTERDLATALGWAKAAGFRGRGYLTEDGTIRLVPNIGHVYFVRVNEFVKIGFAKDVKTRISMLQVGCPYPLELLHVEPGAEVNEKQFHARFSAHRQTGEWFRIEGAVAEFLERKNT